MLSFWTFFIEKKQFTVLLMLALVAAGGIALIAIPKESSPEVEIPIGIVTTVLPGASATDVEKLVTKKIEDEVANINNLDTLTSSSQDGLSMITVAFDANANLDEAIGDLKDAVDRAKGELPTDALDPTVTRVNFADQPILIISVSGDYTPKAMVDLSTVLIDELKTVGGVAKVTASGVPDREVSVVVHKEALAQFGIGLSTITSALSANNASLPIGSITISGVDYAIRFKGEITDPAQVGEIPLQTPSGTRILLHDIAEVYDGLKKPSSFSRVSINGQPAENALTLVVFKKKGGNVATITEHVKSKLEELKPTLLLGASVTDTYDLGEQVNKDLTELTRVGFETVVLVLLVLFATIGWRESIVAGLSIPLSFVIAFIGLYASGNTINFVSLFSLILAVGILVDSGIVVTEAIHTRFKKFGDAKKAAYESLREYAWPLTAGTLTTVAVFVPLFFLSGVTGKFIASIPFTIIFVLMASIFVALGFVPIIAIMFTKKTMNPLEKRQEAYNDAIRTWYMARLRAFLRNKRMQNMFLLALGVAFVVMLSLPSLGIVKVIFFPGGDEDFFALELEMPQGTTLEETDFATRSVEEILYENPDIESFVTTIGSGSSFTGDGTSIGVGSKLANITINLHTDRQKTSGTIAQEVRESLAPIHTIAWKVTEPQNGPPSGAPVLIKFKSDNLDDLEIALAKSERLLSSIPGTRDVDSSIKDAGTAFELSVDRARANEVGLSPIQIASLLRTAITGTTATKIATDKDDIDVVVKLDLNPSVADPNATANATIDDIRQIPVETPKGTVLLGSLLDTKLVKSNTVIRREDRTRIATISAYVNEGTTAIEITNTFNERLASLDLPKGVTTELSGETEDVQKTFQEMFVALIAGVLLMLAILVLEFNSFRYTFYLLLTIPLSLIGVFAGLAITQEPLSFPSMLGVIALAGIIINHAIILLDSMYHLIESRQDLPLEDVVVESAAVRLRPIVLTTVTTVIGMIPLAGASALWGPLAFSVMFGLAFAMVLTLILVPLLFFRWPAKAHRHVKTNGAPV